MPSNLGTDVQHAARILQAGGLVAFPTETVYGLGAVALQELAVARVFEVKGRPRFDPLIVHVAHESWLPQLVAEMPDMARALASRFWPGPLTLVLPKTDAVPDLVTSGLPTVAVRIPNHPIALELLEATGLPLAAPSANPFGMLSPTRAKHVAEQIGENIDYVLDGGPCKVGIESTVIQLGSDTPRLLRPGGLPREEIEAVVGPIAMAAPVGAASEGESQPAPGMLSKHYAPHTRLVVCDSPADAATSGRIGLLTFEPVSDVSRFAAVEVLSETGDLREAAAAFFAALRRLDALELDLIVATGFPDRGLGVALNDRLRRAATR
mgnify:CR=1 FL=1